MFGFINRTNRSNEGVTLEKSALESLFGGRIPLPNIFFFNTLLLHYSCIEQKRKMRSRLTGGITQGL